MGRVALPVGGVLSFIPAPSELPCFCDLRAPTLELPLFQAHGLERHEDWLGSRLVFLETAQLKQVPPSCLGQYEV